ncbi:MAG: hypothetical protein KGH49_02195 [Candidatus Micrarchaeota archaeon]|nr:hypothetical protein [Candidatus Micrarchaeota archaeon]
METALKKEMNRTYAPALDLSISVMPRDKVTLVGKDGKKIDLDNSVVKILIHKDEVEIK